MTDAPGNAEQGGFFDPSALAAALPESAATMLADAYLTDWPAASVRVFRVYRPTPAHYHEHCDEHLYVLTGRGTFWMGDPAAVREVGPGTLLVFPRRMVHAMGAILAHPFTFMAIDTPRRAPTDIVFVDPASGTAAGFLARNAGTETGNEAATTG